MLGQIFSQAHRKSPCTRKNAQPVQGWWKQPWTMLCCPHCSMLSTILFGVATPDCGLIQAQQCWTILLTTLNNAGSTTLFNAVFNSPGQVVRFLPCKFIRQTMKIVICFSVCLGNCPASVEANFEDCIRFVSIRLIQSWYSNIVTNLFRQLCNILVIIATVIMPSSLFQVVNSFFRTCYDKQYEHSLFTTC